MKGYGCGSCPVNEAGCDAKYRGSRCSAQRAKANVDYDPKTKGDLVREMLPDQLANLLAERFCHGFGESDILKWLNAPCSESEPAHSAVPDGMELVAPEELPHLVGQPVLILYANGDLERVTVEKCVNTRYVAVLCDANETGKAEDAYLLIEKYNLTWKMYKYKA